MKKENDEQKCCQNNFFSRGNHCHCGNQSSAIYGLGVIGALFYFLQHAGSFTAVVVGIGKAFFWPALLLFRVFTDLHL